MCVIPETNEGEHALLRAADKAREGGCLDRIHSCEEERGKRLREGMSVHASLQCPFSTSLLLQVLAKDALCALAADARFEASYWSTVACLKR